MLNQQKSAFIPRVDSPAGACLTAAEWKQLSIETLGCQLTPLLFKPGQDFFKKGISLRGFFAWDASMLLDARLPYDKQSEAFQLRSPYDGSRFSLSLADYQNLIECLAPDSLILPDLPEKTGQELISHFSAQAIACFTLEASVQDDTKLYRSQSGDASLITSSRGHPVEVIQHSLAEGSWTQWFSEEPLVDAVQGRLYTRAGIVNLADSSCMETFQTIEVGCGCPSCTAQFTMAYLRHLYYHTPLLCHRFLIAHNVFYVTEML